MISVVMGISAFDDFSILAINSILSQTFLNFELIIVANGANADFIIKKLNETYLETYIKNIFVNEKKDWWDELPNYAKEGIEEGVRDIAEGRVHSYEEIKQYFGWK